MRIEELEEKGRAISQKNRTRGQGDVCIKLVRGGHGYDGSIRWNVSFRFYAGNELKITNSEYLDAILLDKEVYFREVSPGNGKKINRSSDKGPNCEIKYVIGNEKDLSFWQTCQGCYMLLLDRDCGLYYIDLRKKL